MQALTTLFFKVADLIATEFFEQGDIEKRDLKMVPMDMMNRDKKDELPTMQVGFVDSVCIPIYKVICASLFSII